jgi:hypothetical protein
VVMQRDQLHASSSNVGVRNSTPAMASRGWPQSGCPILPGSLAKGGKQTDDTVGFCVLYRRIISGSHSRRGPSESSSGPPDRSRHVHSYRTRRRDPRKDPDRI